MLYTCNRPHHMSSPQERRPVQKVFKCMLTSQRGSRKCVPEKSSEEEKEHYEKAWRWLPKENSNIMKCSRNTDFFWNHLRNQFRFMQEDRWKCHFLHFCSCSYRINGKGTFTKLYVFTCIHRTGTENCEGSVSVFKLWYSLIFFITTTFPHCLENNQRFTSQVGMCGGACRAQDMYLKSPSLQMLLILWLRGVCLTGVGSAVKAAVSVLL